MNKPLSLVIQLQMDASNADISVSQLLRKAKIIATKLEIEEFITWIDLELNGYTTTEVPDYRKFHGTFKALSAYHGWQPVQITDAKLREMITAGRIGSSIGSLESMMNKSQGKSSLALDLHPHQKQSLYDLVEGAIDVTIELPSHTNHTIIEAVRNIVLDWALRLEKRGVLGENLSFSEENKTEARNLTQNFYAGTIGHVGNVSDQASVTNNINHNNGLDIDKLKALVDQILSTSQLLPEEIREETVLTANRLRDQIYNASGAQDEKTLSDSLRSLKTICEGAAGNLMAAGIAATITYMTK